MQFETYGWQLAAIALFLFLLGVMAEFNLR